MQGSLLFAHTSKWDTWALILTLLQEKMECAKFPGAFCVLPVPGCFPGLAALPCWGSAPLTRFLQRFLLSLHIPVPSWGRESSCHTALHEAAPVITSFFGKFSNAPLSAQHWILWGKVLPGFEIIVGREEASRGAHTPCWTKTVILHTTQHHCNLSDVKCSS